MRRYSLFAVTTILAASAVALPFDVIEAAAGDTTYEIAQNDPQGSGQRYLRDGGSIRIPASVDRQRGDRGESDPAGGQLDGVSGIDRLNGDDILEEAREDNLGTAPDIYSTQEREEFLEDGGSIRPVFEDAPGGGVTVLRGKNIEGHWRHVVVKPVNLSSHGSFAVITSDVGYEPGNRGSVRHVSSNGPAETLDYRRFSSAPKIIHVENERLDRRPMPSSGIETIYSGGAKIIRLSRGYRMSDDRDVSSLK
ncbi:hypothetical protein [Jiella mangrovi]|uniref:Uncharacterized protein n=1 Tax=Jiella mangrovi TaxID=2821407 RepID=A0ABS4BN24_9HYPH|nr:hypothetical protein [Jiella mangrovi]MBP0618135.1 hypothetical protein [Jiella mangrovi]